jgi:hypothetical protein
MYHLWLQIMLPVDHDVRFRENHILTRGPWLEIINAIHSSKFLFIACCNRCLDLSLTWITLLCKFVGTFKTSVVQFFCESTVSLQACQCMLYPHQQRRSQQTWPTHVGEIAAADFSGSLSVEDIPHCLRGRFGIFSRA